jgi:hypothetical protein
MRLPATSVDMRFAFCEVCCRERAASNCGSVSAITIVIVEETQASTGARYKFPSRLAGIHGSACRSAMKNCFRELILLRDKSAARGGRSAFRTSLEVPFLTRRLFIPLVVVECESAPG